MTNEVPQIDDSSWEAYKRSLHRAVTAAEEMHVPERRLAGLAEAAGKWLASHVDAELPENRVLNELWQAADKNERHMLAELMLKIVS